MNKLIEKLANSAGGFPLNIDTGDNSYGFRERAIERFAELIVKECLSHVKDRHLCDEIRNSLGIVDEAER